MPGLQGWQRCPSPNISRPRTPRSPRGDASSRRGGRRGHYLGGVHRVGSMRAPDEHGVGAGSPRLVASPGRSYAGSPHIAGSPGCAGSPGPGYGGSPRIAGSPVPAFVGSPGYAGSPGRSYAGSPGIGLATSLGDKRNTAYFTDDDCNALDKCFDFNFEHTMQSVCKPLGRNGETDLFAQLWSQHRPDALKPSDAVYSGAPEASPAYKVTAAAGAAGAAGPSRVMLGPPRAPRTPPRTPPRPDAPLDLGEQRKRKSHHLSDRGLESAPERVQLRPDDGRSSLGAQWRRRSICEGSTGDDDGGDDARPSKFFPDKKQNHSEIEKRRRDKMNRYISELSGMVPLCGATPRKLDKLTVLRLAVQHLRSVRGAMAAPLSARPAPALLRPPDVNALLRRAAHDAFLLVVGCDRGRLHYASASVAAVLNYQQSELMGQSLFDLLHPKDVAKVKEQLTSSDLSPRQRLIDAKTMLPVKAELAAGASRFCPGARRSFFCRVKRRGGLSGGGGGGGGVVAGDSSSGASVKEEERSARKGKQPERRYCVVQCTGYLKSWGAAELGAGAAAAEPEGDEADGGAASCLVAVCRPLPSPPPPAAPLRRLQFTARFTTDGKFLFVDQRVTPALGYLPQELLGSSLYEWVAGDGLGTLARAHRTLLVRRAPLHTPPYAFRRRDGQHATLSTHFKPFRNPWTKEVECLMANSTVLGDEPPPPDPTYDLFKHESDAEISRLIESQVEARKIGAAIAEDALRGGATTPAPSPDVPPELLHDVVFGQNSLMDSLLSAPSGATTPERAAERSPPPPPLGIDGNGEATMAVIMSLLEADAGLGGPINFSGLPWPLP